VSTYYQRKIARQERADDQPCPKCGHRKGAHRDYPVAECYCGCKIDAEALRKAAP
jgi:hypothetical protein